MERGYLRDGVTADAATDILWACSSVELYELLVRQRGWSLPRFAQFVAEFMITSLLPSAGVNVLAWPMWLTYWPEPGPRTHGATGRTPIAV
jgi:hypothetical protein